MTGATLPKREVVERSFDELAHQIKLALDADEKVFVIDFAMVLMGATSKRFGIDFDHPRFMWFGAHHISEFGQGWAVANRDKDRNPDHPRIFGVINWKAADGPWMDDFARWSSQQRLWQEHKDHGKEFVGGVSVEQRLEEAIRYLAEAKRYRDEHFDQVLKEMMLWGDTTVVLVNHVDLRPKEPWDPPVVE